AARSLITPGVRIGRRHRAAAEKKFDEPAAEIRLRLRLVGGGQRSGQRRAGTERAREERSHDEALHRRTRYLSSSEPAVRSPLWFPLNGETSQPIGKFAAARRTNNQTETMSARLRFILRERLRFILREGAASWLSASLKRAITSTSSSGRRRLPG